MQTNDPTFAEQRRRFDFRFDCRDCAHWNPDSTLCSLGYPNEMILDSQSAIDARGEIVFCKHFELV